jgi:hypothetical protein
MAADAARRAAARIVDTYPRISSSGAQNMMVAAVMPAGLRGLWHTTPARWGQGHTTPVLPADAGTQAWVVQADAGGGYADSGLGARLIRESALAKSWASRGSGQPGRSSGVPATTANRSAIPARVAVCNVAAGTGVPPGTGSSRVAVVLATIVGR